MYIYIYIYIRGKAGALLRAGDAKGLSPILSYKPPLHEMPPPPSSPPRNDPKRPSIEAGSMLPARSCVLLFFV